jgi:Hypervirulence associated proteins TUDOR domain
MSCARVVIEDYEPMPCRNEHDPSPKLPRREMRGEKSGEPSFCWVRHTETAATGHYRQRSCKALSLAISELALHPTIPAGDEGHTHHASEDEPQYEIKSDKTDHIAMHKGSALKKLRAK